MKCKKLVLLLLLLILPIGALAASVSTDKPNYNLGAVVSITTICKDVGADVALELKNPSGSTIWADQGVTNNKYTYSSSYNTQTDSSQGTYAINIACSGETAKTTFIVGEGKIAEECPSGQTKCSDGVCRESCAAAPECPAGLTKCSDGVCRTNCGGAPSAGTPSQTKKSQTRTGCLAYDTFSHQCQRGETDKHPGLPIDCCCNDNYYLINGKCSKPALTAPTQYCGNNKKEGQEQCDGADNSACGGKLCARDCTCSEVLPEEEPKCGDYVCQTGETASSCPGDCKKKIPLWFWGIGGAILLVILILFIYFKRHGGVGELSKAGEESTDFNSHLHSYIQNALQHGYTPQILRRILIKSGWPPDTVDRALESFS